MKRRGLLALLGLTTTAALLPKVEAKTVEKATEIGPLHTPIGMLMPWSPNANAVPPLGWLSCYGQAVSRVQYQELFEAIGTTFGPGDGQTTFNIPDLRATFQLPDYRGHTHYVEGVPLHVHSHAVGGMIGAVGGIGDPYQPVYTTGRYIGNGEYEAVPAHNHFQPTMVVQHIIRAL